MKHLLIVALCLWVLGGAVAMGQALDVPQATNSTGDSHAGTARMSIGEQFDMLYQSLKETRAGYGSDVMKTLAFLIIALGWFITSDKSREYFRSHRAARISSIVALAVLCLIHIRYCILDYFTSQRLIGLLNDLNYLDTERYSTYAITIAQLTTNLVQNVALFAVLMVILSTMRRPSQTT